MEEAMANSEMIEMIVPKQLVWLIKGLYDKSTENKRINKSTYSKDFHPKCGV